MAIILHLSASKVSKLYIEYWKLRGLDRLNSIFKETNGKLWPFLKLYKELIKKRGMNIEQVINTVDIAVNRLPHIESLYKQAKDEAEKMQRTIQRLENDIEERKNKILFLDRIAFTSEQDGKQIQQQVQELIDQKNRIERLIANILNNGEGYSKVKQIVKENVKAVLSDNKIVISISFAAVIQTLKADPQMTKLIQNIPSTNDGEQHKENTNNDIITKYLESNKDRILALTEKHYENLVKALTNNAIATAIASPSNLTLSQPQSSSTFPNLSTQSNMHRKEQSETFHNNKGNIAD